MSHTVKLISPADGQVVVERAYAESAAIAAVLDKAEAAQKAWAKTTIADRAEQVTAFVDAMLAMKDEIIPELAKQMGRPVRFGAGELAGFEERARHMIAIAETALAPVKPEPKDGFDRYIVREPVGTVFVIAPWNYPYLTAVNAVVPALMAGNAVVLKHAAQTLLVGERFQAAADQAGLPDGLFTNLLVNHDGAAEVIASGRVHQVNFTGSVRGGQEIEKAAAGHFLSVGLELGGKDPAYVRADADVAFAVENLVDGAFFNSGQSCCGIERIYVHRAVYDAFVDGAVALARSYVLGDPLNEETTIGPVVKPEAAEFVRGQIAEAVEKGATAHIAAGSFPLDQPGSAYCGPQILTGVDHTMRVMTEESFGPVVGIMPVDSDEEAIALMNDSEYGLTASIWTADLAKAAELGAEIETGTVFANRSDYLDPALAWTGVKNTGRGATLSAVGYEHMTRPKSFHLRAR